MFCKALRASKHAAAYDALTAEYAARGLPVPASAKRKARKKAIDEREQLGQGLPQNVAEEAQQHSPPAFDQGLLSIGHLCFLAGCHH